jgi:uncharacterized protein (TIGR03382 family)
MKHLAEFMLGALAFLVWIGPARPCSVFTAHDDQTVLAGNNEDYYGDDPTIIWFVPPEDGKYGYVAWGFQSNHFSQGGMNDQGLFWDGLATAEHTLEGDDGTKPFTLTTLEEVMQASATVDEAIANLREYRLSGVLGSAQLMFMDRFGDSVIFEGDVENVPTTNYQVATNFLPSRPDLGGYPCWRYITLTRMMEQGLELTVAYFAEMADAAHQGTEVGPGIYTRYTTIGDLVEGRLYLYMDLDYGRYVEFDLDEELALGPHEYLMSDLFPPEQDGGVDAGMDAGHDAGTDAGADEGAAPDSGRLDGADGADAGVDAGTDEAPPADPDGEPSDGDGCGCASGAPGSAGWVVLFLVSMALVRRTAA